MTAGTAQPFQPDPQAALAGAIAPGARAFLAGLPHGLRTAAAVILSLALAFALQLDNPFWAGTTAALLCQPILGSSLRKAMFRAVGTMVGAVVCVTLFAAFAQERVGFVLALAAWCAACCFVGNRLRFFATYGAMLAGYTAAILWADLVDTPDRSFDVALARVAEIVLGVMVTAVVLSATQAGDSRRRLAAALRDLSGTVVADLVTSLDASPPTTANRAFMIRLVGLDAVADEALGEEGQWPFQLGPVRAAQNGLFTSMAAVQSLREAIAADPLAVGTVLRPAVHLLNKRTAASLRHASVQLDVAAAGPAGEAAATLHRGLLGAALALEVADWLDDPGQPPPAVAPADHAAADALPALVSAARAFCVVVVLAAAWVATAWPDGPTAVAVGAIVALLLSPYQELAAKAAAAFVIGMALTTILAATVKFALLPQVPQSIWGLAAALALVLVPLASLSTIARLAPIASPSLLLFIPLVSPTNEMTYDAIAFWNAALAILAGCVAAAVALEVVPSVAAQVRTQRILVAARAEHAAVRAGEWRPSAEAWTSRMRSRAAGLPPAAADGAYIEILALFGHGLRDLQGGARPRARGP